MRSLLYCRFKTVNTNNQMKLKSLVLLFFSFCWLGFSQQDVAEIEFIGFDSTSNYAPGSGVSVHINPIGIYRMDDPGGLGTDVSDNNKFLLELSDSSGNFGGNILTEIYDFYVPLINGVIPADTPPGSNYRLRVVASQGFVSTGVYNSIESNPSSPFTISAGSFVDYVDISSGISSISNNFFDCIDGDGYNVSSNSATPYAGSLNRSDGALTTDTNVNPSTVPDFNFEANTGSNYSAYLFDITNGGVYSQSLSIDNIGFGISRVTVSDELNNNGLPIGTYNLEIKETNSDGISSVYSVIFLWHSNNTNLGNTTSETICLGEQVIFSIDNTSAGIARNYVSSYYSFNFGDNSPIEYFTHAELMHNSEVEHIYGQVSCESSQGESGSNFIIEKQLFNKFRTSSSESCDDFSINGLGAIKEVNVSDGPEASFTVSDEQCETSPIIATNTSILGQWGLEGICLDDAFFDWYVKEPGSSDFILVNSIPQLESWLVGDDLVIPASNVTAGCWEIYLIAYNEDLCQIQSQTPTQTVSVQSSNIEANFQFLDNEGNAIPEPIEICIGDTVNFDNLTNTLSIDCQNDSFLWSISPVSSTAYQFVNNTDEDSISPDVIFNEPGTYQVTLNASNNCDQDSITKPITVLDVPTVDFIPSSLDICETINENTDCYTLDFSDPLLSPTYNFNSSQDPLYNWTISGGVLGVDYTFENGTSQDSKYPIIKFCTFGIYQLTVSINGVSCPGSDNSTFTFTYEQTPIIENNNLLQELCSGDQTQEVVYNSDMPSATYSYTITADAEISGYEGIDFSNGIPIITLINSPPSNVTNNLTITVTPTVGNCTGNPADFIFTVNPTPVIPNQTTAICSEETFVINPTNAPPNTIVPSGTTYVWTVADNANVTGDTSESSPQTAISQQLINTTNTVQTVIYTVIPTSGADGLCEGDPFTVTVDVNPKPSIEDITPPAICSGNSFSETPTNGGGVSGADIVPSGTTYTWTVVDSSGEVIGDSNQSTPQTSIGQTLTNTSNIPQTVVYTVVPTSGVQGNCDGDPFTITVVVNPEPMMDNVLNQTICGGTALATPIYNSDVSGVTYSWELTSTNIPAEISGYPSPNGTGELTGSVIQNSGDTTFTLTYNLSVFYDGCLGNTVPFSVTVDPAPTVIFDISNQGVCNGNTSIPVNLSSPTNNVNISWSIDPTLYPDISGITQTSGTTEIPSFTLTNTSNPPTPINLVFTTQAQMGSTAGCNGEVVEYIITVNPPAQVNQPDDQVVCNGASTDVINFTSINLGNIGGSQTTPSGVDTIFLTFNQGYLGTVGSNTNQSNNILTFETLGILNVSFTQEDTDGNGLFDLDQGNDISGSVTINFTDGSSETFGAIINFRENVQNNELEVIGFVFDDLVNYSFNYGNNQTYTIAGGTTPNVSTLMGLAVYDASVQFIDNEDRPSNAASAQVLDDLNNYLISVSEFSGTSSYSWVNDTSSIGLAASGNGPIDSFIAENLLNDPVVATITVTPYFESAGVSCQGTPVDFTITVNPTPEITNPESSQTICSDGNTSVVTWQSSITNGEPTTFVWNFVSANAGLTGHLTGSGSGDLPLMTINNTGNDIEEVVYEVIPTAYGCEGTPFIYTIYVNPDVEIANSETNQTLCSEDTSSEVIWTLTNPALETSTTFDWALQTATVPSGTTGLISNGQGNLPIMDITITSTTSAAIEYVITPVFDDCPGTPFTYTLNIDPRPIMDAITPQIICSETAFDAPILNSDVSGTVFDWELLNTSSIPSTITGYPTDNTQLFSSSSITNNGTDPFTLEYQFTPSFNGCDGDSQVFSITINPSPATELDLDAQEICSGGTSLPFIASSLTQNVTFSWEITSDISGLSGITTTSGTVNSSNEIPSLSASIINGSTSIDIVIEVVATTENIICDGPPTLHTITVVQDPVAIISSDPPPICVGGTIDPITTTYTGGTGTPSYQWYDNSTGILQPIMGENSSSYDPGIMDTAGTFSFLVVIQFLDSTTGCNQTSSDLATVEVVNDPVLVNPLPTQTICENTTPEDLVRSASGGTGTYTFEWFESSNPTIVLSSDTNVTSSTFTPPTDVVGTFNYYVVVTTEASGCETTSSISEVIVNEGASVSVQPLAEQTVCLDGTTTTLEVQYSNGVGTPTYQWYSNTTCDTSDLSTPIVGETLSTYTPPSDTVGSVYYFVQLSFADGGCGSITSDCALVNVGEIPVIEDVSETICSLDTFTITPTNGGGLNANDIVPIPTLYSWTISANGFILGASDNSTPVTSISQTLENTTNVSQQLTYTVTPISDTIGNCIGDPFEINVTIDPVPTISDETITICSADPIVFTPSGDGSSGSDIVPANTTYTWTFTENPNVTGETNNTIAANDFSQNLINTVHTQQTVIYQVTPISDLGCAANSFTITVILDPVPSILDQSDEICSGDTFDIIPLNNLPTEILPTGTTYTWATLGNTNLTGWSDETTAQSSISQTLINTNTISEQITYVVTPQSGVCTGATFEVVIDVLPNPVINSISPSSQVLCSGDDSTPVVFGATVAGTGFEYSLTNTSIPTEITGYEAHISGTGDLPSMTLFNGLTDPYVLNYEVSPTAENCNGIPSQFTITINPSPQIIFSELDQVLCNADSSLSVNLSSSSPNVIIEWTRNNPVGLTGFVTGDESGTTQIPSYNVQNTTNTPIDLIFTAVATTDDVTACAGNEFYYTITINPTATIDPISDQIICSQSAFADVFITSPTQPTTSITYIWEVTSAGPNLSGYTASSGPIGISSPILGEAIFNASNVAEDLVYTLTPFYDNCEGVSQTFTITIDPTPEIPDLNATICSEETFDVLPENGIPTATTIVPANTTYTWTVLPNPNVTGQSDETLPQSSISQTLTNVSNVAQDVIYIVTPTSSDGCEGASFELTVTVETRPIIEDKIAGACSGDAFLFAPVDNSPTEIVPANTLYTWTVLPGADLPDLTGYSDQTTGVSAISQTLTNLTDESKTIIYSVIPSSGTCVGLPFEVEVTVSPRPFVDDIILAPICSEDTFTVIPETALPSPNNIVPIGTTFTWTVVDNPNVIGDTNEVSAQSQISQTLTNTTSTTQTVVYTVVPSSSGCDGLPFTIAVDVKPRPFIVSGPETQDTQCSGDAFVISPQDGIPTLTTLVPVGTQYTWTTVGNPNLLGWSDQTIAVDLISQTLENTSNQVQQIIYSITPEADGCVGPSFDAVITIEPKPFVPDVIADICDATSYTLSPQNGILPDATTIIPDVTTYTWSTAVVTGGITGASSGVDEAFFDSGVLENPTTNLQTAIYTVTPNYYTVSNPTTPQCSGEPFTITITVSPSPEINEVITNIACSYSDPLCGASIEISPVGMAPFTYNWVSIEGNPINDPTDEDQFDLCPGNYELTITDASNCSYVFQYEIVPPEPVDFTLITQTDISCNNVNTLPCDGSIEVSTTGGTLPYSLVEWYTETIPGSGVFDSGPLINVINPYNLVNACEGNYVLKILDANGCEFVSEVYTIEQAVEPIILTETFSNYNGFNIDCNAANSGTITVDISGGSGVFDYTFVEDATGAVLDANTILSSPATLVFDFLIAGDYTLIVEDPNCSNQIIRNYTLTQPDELIITATLVDPVSCFGGLATYDVTAIGGVPPYTGTGLQSVLSGPVTFIVSDQNGCEDDFSTIVTEPAELLATYTIADAPCFGDTGEITVTPTGGTGILSVNLYNETNTFITNFITTQGNAVTFNQLEGTYFYDVVDQNNCSYGPEVVVVDEPDPINIIDFEVIQPDCNTTPAWEFNNGSICVTITGGTNPFPIGTGWVDNGGGQWCLNNLSAGTYPIDVTDINNCTLQNPIPDITLVRPPEITAVLTDTLDIDCDTDTATQINTIIVNGGVPPYQVTWSGGIVDAANPFVMQTSVAGNYSAFVNDQYGIINGCPPIEFPLDPITFFDFGIADFTLSSDNSDFCGIYAINDPIQFNNSATGDIVNYTWNYGDGSPEFNGPDAPDHVYNAIGTYTISLTVEDLYGCFDTYSETIEITKGYEIILPNGFTPNGDGINETIRPVTICMTEVQMSIYDTWGALIYAETSDDLYGWDGTIDGKPAENGNYIMVVTATSYNGAVIELNGPVTLIK